MPSNIQSNTDDLVEEDDSNSWVVTFADLVTLLLVFFVLLFALANADKGKYESILTDLNITVDHGGAHISLIELIHNEMLGNQEVSLEELIGLHVSKDVEEVIETNSLAPEILADINNATKDFGEYVEVFNEGDVVIIRIKGKLLFASGQAKLNSAALPIFNKILKVFIEYPDYNIRIEGHTDNIPIKTLQFPSNWELSAIRSTTVLRYFIEQEINPARLTATGYGDLLPLVENDSKINRAKNRRVEFVLEKENKNTTVK